MALLAGVFLAVVGIAGAIAARSLRERETAQLRESLIQRGRLVDALVVDARFHPSAIETLDALADRAGHSAQARVTLIAEDGVVVGDSDVAVDQVLAMANHGGRPEVQATRGGSIGGNVRMSATLGRELFYLALPRSGDQPGVIRLAVDFSDLEAAYADLRRLLGVAGAVALVASVVLSYGISWITLRPVLALRRSAISIAGGDLRRRPSLRFDDEFGEIAEAIDRMADQLRKRLAEVSAEKEKLRAVLDAMDEALLVVDAQGEILLANPRLRDFFGIEGEVEGRNALEVIRHPQLDELISQAGSDGAGVSGEIEVSHPTVRILHVRAVGYAEPEHSRVEVVAVLHDATELVRLERVRRDFVANASHELRTPLTAIRGFTETLLSNPVDEENRRTYLETIDRHARRLTRLVEDLMQLSRIESQAFPSQAADVDLASLAHTLVEDARPRFDAKGVKLVQRSAAHAPLRADPHVLERVLTNLLDNALSYTEPGGRVEVEVDADDRWIRAAVRDSGIGIPEADLDRIFERFYRVDRARSRALGGTGLGLSIVKHLVQESGGEISVESRLGEGSTFTLTWPASS